METVAILVATIALIVSIAAAVYTRQQARESIRANNSSELVRLRGEMAVTVSGNDPVHLVATVESLCAEELDDVAICIVPVEEPARIGFWVDDTGTDIDWLWKVDKIRPGMKLMRPMSDLRPGGPDVVRLSVGVTVDGRRHSWFVPVTVAYPPNPQVMTIWK